MAFKPELDDPSTFEAKDTARKIPVGFSLLYWGLILFGAYYLWAYTPAFGGWRQAMDAEGGGASLKGSTGGPQIVFHTDRGRIALHKR